METLEAPERFLYLMATPSRMDVTGLLVDWGKGDQEALNKLMPLVYDELRRLASRYLRNRAGRSYPSDHRARSRGVSETGGPEERELAKPRAVLRRSCAGDASHPGGLREKPEGF